MDKVEDRIEALVATGVLSADVLARCRELNGAVPHAWHARLALYRVLQDAWESTQGREPVLLDAARRALLDAAKAAPRTGRLASQVEKALREQGLRWPAADGLEDTVLLEAPDTSAPATKQAAASHTRVLDVIPSEPTPDQRPSVRPKSGSTREMTPDEPPPLKDRYLP